VALLDRVLTRASEGSMLLQASLEDIRESLEHADIDINIPWMDPDSSAADRVRHLAERALKDLPSLADARTAAEDDRQELERRLTSVRRPIGWLIFEGDRWQCRTLKSATDEGDLCVVVPGADKKGVWKTVGSVKDGSVLVTGDEDAGLAEGRPVFLFKRTQDRS
jgi:hypothetical protein